MTMGHLALRGTSINISGATVTNVPFGIANAVGQLWLDEESDGILGPAFGHGNSSELFSIHRCIPGY